MPTFRLKSGEHRFIGSSVTCEPGAILYIDPTTWCIHGDYTADGKKIETKTRVHAQLPGAAPFTLAWVGDLHATGKKEPRLNEIASVMARLNPTLSLLLGDVVNGSGEYRGSDMSNGWFENAWNAFKNVPNHMWVKGNHDVDPLHYEFYNWYERLWTLRIGSYKFIAFDTFNEERVISGTSHTFISMSDVLWLRRRLVEDEAYKIILSHHLFSEWRIFAYLALKDAVNLRYVFTGHDHKAYVEETKNAPALVNGTASPEAGEHLVSLTTFYKNGEISTVLVKDIEIRNEDGSYKVKVDFKPLEGRPAALVRISPESAKPLNIYVEIGEHGTAQLTLKNGEIWSDSNIYITGRNLKMEGAEPYDTWHCFCGAKWRTYRLKAGIKGIIL